MIDTLWFHNGKTAAKAQELGLEGFGRLVCDIHLVAGRNDLEYLAQFDFVRTSDPGVEHWGDAVYPNGDCDAGRTSVAPGCGSGVLDGLEAGKACRPDFSGETDLSRRTKY
jgi:hypothetical protein